MLFDHSLDVILPSIASNITIGGNGSFIIPTGTTAARPTGITGAVRFNTDTNAIEYYDTAWQTISSYDYLTANYQPLSVDLTIISSLSSTGIVVRQTAGGAYNLRTITAGSSKLSVVNGNMVSGNAALDVVEANLTLNNIGGTLAINKGGTNLTSVGSANQLLGVNAAAAALEYKTLTAGTGISVTHGVGTVTVAASAQYRTLQMFYGSFTPATGTTTIPYDNTTPTSSEGTQVWSQAITPASNTNIVRITLSTTIGTSTGDVAVIVALFRGTTCVDARITSVGAAGVLGATASGSSPVAITLIDTPATTSATTYSLRVGISSAGTWVFGRGDTATLNNAAAGRYIVEELSS